MKCSVCDRRSPASRKNCMYCGGELVPDRRDTPIRCCGCSSVMYEVDRNGIVIDVCPNCDGLWFDVGELEMFIKTIPTPSQMKVDSKKKEHKVRRAFQSIPEFGPQRNCPHCNLMMGKKNFKNVSGVIVDVCRFHGVFLDPLELDKIRLFVATGGTEEEKKTQTEDRAYEIKRQQLIRSRTQYSKSNSANDGPYELFEIIMSVLRDFWL